MQKSEIMEEPLLEIRLFGSFSACLRGQALPPLRSRAEKWLLMLLALRPGHALSREWLSATLWPDSEPALGLYNLRRSLTNLRKALDTQAHLLLSPTPQTLCLDPTRVRVDVACFDAAIRAGSVESLEQAVALYRGTLLEDCAEEWALTARIEREQAYLAALETLADHAIALQQPTTAVRYLRLTIAADPLREAAYGALMQSLADCGDYAALTQVYRDLRLLLRRELNIAPSAEIESLYRNLQQQAKQVILPPPLPSSLPPRRLPVPLTNLVGRENDIVEVVGRLQKERLVTLLGSGGVGKTRLAIAAAEVLAPWYPDGVWFVELASLSEPALVTDAVARTLGVKEEPGQLLVETLAAALAARSLLLILDNCEHLLDACSSLADTLLSRCGALHLLATSREALGLMGEHHYHTPSLALPPIPSANRPSDAEEKDLAWLMEYGGMQLFVERARQVQPSFHLTERNAASVLRVVRHLDGIPLAIELAAARVRSLSIEEIRTRLQDCFALLESGHRTALPRHRTLRALIDWSYDLLTEEEKSLLRRLSVFAGGWTLQAAVSICANASEESPDDILALLTALVDKSLVAYEEQEGLARYRLLETVRQYAEEQLVESGEKEAYHSRHRNFFLALAEEANKELIGPKPRAWLTRLEIEQDNLRQALRRSLEEEEAEAGLRLGAALQRFWQIRGPLSEGRECLTALLARPAARKWTRARADALYGAARLAFAQSDYVSMRSFAEESLEIRRELGDREGIANSLNTLGDVAWRQADYTAARPLHEESLRIRQEIGDQRGIANSLQSMGNLAVRQGDPVTARSLYEQSLSIRRVLGDPMEISATLNNLGHLAWVQGDYASARVLNDECLAIYRELGDRNGIALSLIYQARVTMQRGDYAGARALFTASLEVYKELGNRQGIASCLNSLGDVDWRQGDYAGTHALLEESRKIFRELGDRQGIAHTNLNLGIVADILGEPAEAHSLQEESLEIYRELGDSQGIALALYALALGSGIREDYTVARSQYEEALAILRKLGNRNSIANLLINLGEVLRKQGDYAGARALQEESLGIFREMEDREGLTHSLEAFASLNLGEAKCEKATRLLGAAERLRDELGLVMAPDEVAEQDLVVALVRAALDEKDFAAAWAFGRSMSLEQALAYALE